jgi:hypothetical protein
VYIATSRSYDVAFPGNFFDVYNGNGNQAGTYVSSDGKSWVKQ